MKMLRNWPLFWYVQLLLQSLLCVVSENQKLRCCIHGLSVNVLFVFRQRRLCRFCYLIWWSPLLGEQFCWNKGYQIWVEMIELFLNCGTFTLDEIQYRSLINDWSLRFCYLALHFLEAKVKTKKQQKNNSVCSVLRIESGLKTEVRCRKIQFASMAQPCTS